ncbi:thioredoxin-disulfide reductase [Candidatus Micrarchaeota archaeon]|nr:thioredoxin-disulfide reductase [Candidatus Micrarchaeota archaeon]
MIYDVAILGAGPAGLSAAIYTSRAGRSTLLLEKGLPGGWTATSSIIENYLGLGSSPGPELASKMEAHAKKFGAELKPYTEVTEVIFGDEILLKTPAGDFKARTLIIATGQSARKLSIPGEKEFMGKGVSYCATCDGPFFQDKAAAVIGGGNSAVEEAVYLTKFASKVYIIHRRNQFRAEKAVQEKAEANPKIEIIWDTEPREIKGKEFVESIILSNKKTEEISELKVDGVFIYIGMVPNTFLFDGKFEMKNGYVPTDENMRTNFPNVFCAGDARFSPVKQIATAVGEGATAGISADRYLSSL